MRYLLFGGSGILGSGFEEALRRREGAELVRVSPDWTRPHEASREAAAAVAGTLGGPAGGTVLWAAGIGQVGTSRAAMAGEGVVLGAVCCALAGLPGPARRSSRLLFASSAGALFGGSDGRVVIDEEARPAPVSAYGHEKLDQEQVCHHLAAQDGVQVLICRYTNLYGLASGLLPHKGLIPATIRAARHRQPMTVFVSPDTRRDYVYGRDAAAASLALADRLADGHSAEWTRGVATALVAQGATTTVAQIVAEVGGIVGRRVPATFAVRPESALQPRALRFAPRDPVPTLTAPTSMAVAIHRMVHAPAG